MIRLVIDANIVVSALVAGNLSDLIFSPQLELIAPELLFVELRKHQKTIRKRSAFPEKEADILIALLQKKIKTVPMEEFLECYPDAEYIVRDHLKDLPYVALALKLNCPFWTYEKRFSGRIETIMTGEVRRLVKDR